MAQVIHDRLAEKGITSFLDLEELRSGKFNEKLYEAIDNSNNFILILSKGALDGCISSNDWVRKEILEAGEKNKAISIAKTLKQMKMDDASISKATGLSIEEVHKLKAD